MLVLRRPDGDGQADIAHIGRDTIHPQKTSGVRFTMRSRLDGVHGDSELWDERVSDDTTGQPASVSGKRAVLHHGLTPPRLAPSPLVFPWLCQAGPSKGQLLPQCVLGSFAHLPFFIGARRYCPISARNGWPDVRNVNPLRYIKQALDLAIYRRHRWRVVTRRLLTDADGNTGVDARAQRPVLVPGVVRDCDVAASISDEASRKSGACDGVDVPAAAARQGRPWIAF